MSILEKSLTVMFSHGFNNLAPYDPKSVESLSKTDIVATEGYTLVQNDDSCLHCYSKDLASGETSTRQVTFLINKHNAFVHEELKNGILQANKI